MKAMTDTTRLQARQETERHGLAPWIASGWAALVLLGAASALLDRAFPSANVVAATTAAATVPAPTPASPAWPQTP